MPNKRGSISKSTRAIQGTIKQRRNDWLGAATSFESAAHRHPTDASLWFKAGNAYFRAEQYPNAITALLKATQLDPSKSDWWYRLGFVMERTKNYQNAIDAYNKAESSGGSLGVLSYRRGRCYGELHDSESAKVEYLIAITEGHDPKSSYQALASFEPKTTPLWQKLELRRKGQQHFNYSDQWTLDHARFASLMGDHKTAAELFLKIDRTSPLTGKDRFSYALALASLSDTDSSEHELRTLLNNLPAQDRPFGIGSVFQKHGMWTRAREYYLKAKVPQKSEAELLYRIGFTFDREYKWADAQSYYEAALQIRPNNAYWHYKCGHSAERQSLYDQAVNSYISALELDPSKKYWWYRVAVSLKQLGKYSPAADATLKSWGESLNPVRDDQDDPATYDAHQAYRSPSNTAAKLQHILEGEAPNGITAVTRDISSFSYWAERAATAGQTDTSRELVRRAIAADHKMARTDRAHLTQILTDLGDSSAALSLALDDRTFQRPDGIDTAKYTKTEATRRIRTYAEYRETRDIDPKTVLFESNHGSSAGCHPLALFRFMKDDPRFDEFIFIWAVNDSSTLPRDVADNPRTFTTKLHSDNYLYHLATAKYLINNVSFAPYFVRRQEQRYLNTWHGTPMKTLGRSMRQGIIEYENLERNFLQATHIMAPNELTRWALINEHHIDGIYAGATMITGSPRLDRLVNDGALLRQHIRSELGVSENETLVLVAPTWRGGVSTHDVDAEGLSAELGALAQIEGVRVFYRAHRLTEKLVRDLDLPATIVPSTIDTNDLLAAVDHLVSDYSSISFDFLATGKPVTLFVPDEEQYVRDRGLYINPQDLPFGVARTVPELTALVASPVTNAPGYEAARSKYAPMEDGHSSQRCVDFLLSDDHFGNELNSKRTYVFHASMIPNGIASAVRSLFQTLVTMDINVVLIVEPKVLRLHEERYEQLTRLPPEVKLVSRVGDLTTTPEETYIRTGVESLKFSPGIDMKARYRKLWDREARRILGATHVDAAIEWDGYASLWANMILGVGTSETVHAIWQHNDMALERADKFPELDRVYASYPNFDTIVSVSTNLRDENQQHLSEVLGISDRTVSVVHNIIQPKEIVELSLAPIDPTLLKTLSDFHPVVVTIGRMSPEKNQEALLDAWSRVIREHPDACLVIIGSGPRYPDLLAKQHDLSLEKSVVFTGQLSNPLPVLRAADLFVLPSTHEGQPVVLFEAMTLGTSVAASELPGNIEAMNIGYGKTLSREPEQMATDIAELLRSSLDSHPTDWVDRYVKRSLHEFATAVGDCGLAQNS